MQQSPSLKVVTHGDWGRRWSVRGSFILNYSKPIPDSTQLGRWHGRVSPSTLARWPHYLASTLNETNDGTLQFQPSKLNSRITWPPGTHACRTRCKPGLRVGAPRGNHAANGKLPRTPREAAMRRLHAGQALTRLHGCVGLPRWLQLQGQ